MLAVRYTEKRTFMTDVFTKRNHYNPCFWTAMWNRTYFRAFLDGDTEREKAREQTVWVLNFRSARIYETKVDSVHYDKGLGIAEINTESMKRFCRKWFPSEYNGLASYITEHPESLYLDFEDILAGIESKGVYDSLMEAVKIGDLYSVEHKGFLTVTLIIHAMRSHEMMASMVEAASLRGMDKWEYFWLLKNVLGNPSMLARAVTPLACSRWVLYRTDDHRFPLCDSPVMINRDTVMVVLSPRLLLEINLNTLAPENDWTVRDSINKSKFREFRRRSIENGFKQLIFSDREELEEWSKSPGFKARNAALNDINKRRNLIGDSANRVIWAMAGFGRVPQDFERSVRHIFNA
jgi:hypothetical protein